MTYWSGALMLVAALWLLRDAFVRRARVRDAAIAAAAQGAPIVAGNARLAVLADVVPRLVIAALVIAAVQIVAAWWFTPMGGWFSGFDIAALLFLLLAYGCWLILKTRYRPGWQPPTPAGR